MAKKLTGCKRRVCISSVVIENQYHISCSAICAQYRDLQRRHSHPVLPISESPFLSSIANFGIAIRIQYHKFDNRHSHPLPIFPALNISVPPGTSKCFLQSTSPLCYMYGLCLNITCSFFVFFFFIAANIVIQTEPPPAVPENTNVNRVVVEPERKRPLGIMNDGPFAKKPWADK